MQQLDKCKIQKDQSKICNLLLVKRLFCFCFCHFQFLHFLRQGYKARYVSCAKSFSFSGNGIPKAPCISLVNTYAIEISSLNNAWTSLKFSGCSSAILIKISREFRAFLCCNFSIIWWKILAHLQKQRKATKLS